MIPSAVVDSSVVMRWFVRDRWSDAALTMAETYRLTAPAFLKVEVANALRNQVRLAGMTVEAALVHLTGLKAVVAVVEDEPLLPAAFRLAADRDHPVYDCVYLALAMREGVPLLTADLKLARKFVGSPGLEILTPETV